MALKILWNRKWKETGFELKINLWYRTLLEQYTNDFWSKYNLELVSCDKMKYGNRKMNIFYVEQF